MKKTKIITLTLNPAFDLHCSIQDFAPYQECYAETLSVDAGGKGINISRALKVNGTDSLAIVVVGAENAMEFCKALNRDGLQYEEIWAEGRIRQNITLHEEDKPETRISFTGFKCDQKILRKVQNRVEIDEKGYLRVYDATTPEEIVSYLYQNKVIVSEIKTDKIGLEEYYIDLMSSKEGK